MIKFKTQEIRAELSEKGMFLNITGEDSEIEKLYYAAVRSNEDFRESIITVMNNATSEEIVSIQQDCSYKSKIHLYYNIFGKICIKLKYKERNDLVVLLNYLGVNFVEFKDMIFKPVLDKVRETISECVFEASDEDKAMCSVCGRHKSQHKYK